MQISTEKMAIYRATARRRRAKEEQVLAQRQTRAWELARQAAALLKKEFGATQVMLFGSLAHGHWFSRTSDIDLAVWDLQGEDYFIVVAKLQDLSPEFGVDLVMMEMCKPNLHETIIRMGEVL